MSRPLRIQMPGLTYHIHTRGNGRMAIYLDDRDRDKFLELLADIVDQFSIDCHAFCMMANHYHLVATTREASLSAAAHRLNGRYAQWWNRRHDHIGHVFHRRFGAQVVQDDTYLLVSCRYAVLNPVRAHLVERPEQWPWSSYRATAGLDAAPDFLRPETLWRLLGDNDPAAVLTRYMDFVRAVNDDGRILRDVPVIGDADFVARFKEIRARASREVPRRDREARPGLDRLFANAVTRTARNASALEARAAGYPITEIARHLGLHRSTVSKMIGAIEGSGVKKASPSDLAPEA